MTTSTGTAATPRTAGERSPQKEQGAAGRETQPATEAMPAMGGRTATVTLPFVTAQFRVHGMTMPRVSLPRIGRPHISTPHVSVPDPQQVARAAVVGVSYLPPPERLAYYAGLGALAVAGMVEWPVAVAIGAGTMVAQRAGRQHRHAPAERAGTATQARPATTTPDKGAGTPAQAATTAPDKGAGTPARPATATPDEGTGAPTEALPAIATTAESAGTGEAATTTAPGTISTGASTRMPARSAAAGPRREPAKRTAPAKRTPRKRTP